MVFLINKDDQILSYLLVNNNQSVDLSDTDVSFTEPINEGNSIVVTVKDIQLTSDTGVNKINEFTKLVVSTNETNLYTITNVVVTDSSDNSIIQRSNSDNTVDVCGNAFRSYFGDASKKFNVQFVAILNEDNDSWIFRKNRSYHVNIHLETMNSNLGGFLEEEMHTSSGNRETHELSVTFSVDSLILTYLENTIYITSDPQTSKVEFRNLVNTIVNKFSLDDINVRYDWQHQTQYTLDVTDNYTGSASYLLTQVNTSGSNLSNVRLQNIITEWDAFIQNGFVFNKVDLKLYHKNADVAEITVGINVYVKNDDFSLFNSSNVGQGLFYDSPNPVFQEKDVIYKSQGDQYKQQLGLKISSITDPSNVNHIKYLNLVELVDLMNDPGAGLRVEVSTTEQSKTQEINTDFDLTVQGLPFGADLQAKFIVSAPSNVDTVSQFIPYSHLDTTTSLPTYKQGKFPIDSIPLRDIVLVGQRTKVDVSPSDNRSVVISTDSSNVSFDLTLDDGRSFSSFYDICNNGIITLENSYIKEYRLSTKIVSKIPLTSIHRYDPSLNQLIYYETDADLKIITVTLQVNNKEDIELALHLVDNQQINYTVQVSLNVKSDKDGDLTLTDPSGQYMTWNFDTTKDSKGYELFPISQILEFADAKYEEITVDGSENLLFSNSTFNQHVLFTRVEAVIDGIFTVDASLTDPSANKTYLNGDVVGNKFYVDGSVNGVEYTDGEQLTNIHFTLFDNSGGRTYSTLAYTYNMLDSQLLALSDKGYLEITYFTINTSGYPSSPKTLKIVSKNYHNTNPTDGGLPLFDEAIRTQPSLVLGDGSLLTSLNIELTHQVCTGVQSSKYVYSRSGEDIIADLLNKLTDSTLLLRNRHNELQPLDLTMFKAVNDFNETIDKFEFDAGTVKTRTYTLDKTNAFSLVFDTATRASEDDIYGVLPFTITATQSIILVDALVLEFRDNLAVAPERFYYENQGAYETRLRNGILSDIFDITGGFTDNIYVVNSSVSATNIVGLNASNSITLQYTISDGVQLVAFVDNTKSIPYTWQFFTLPSIKDQYQVTDGNGNIRIVPSRLWTNIEETHYDSRKLEPTQQEFIADVVRRYADGEYATGDISKYNGESGFLTTGSDAKVWNASVSYSIQSVQRDTNLRKIQFTDKFVITLSFITPVETGKFILNGNFAPGTTAIDTLVFDGVLIKDYIRNTDSTFLAFRDVSSNIPGGVKITYKDDYSIQPFIAYAPTELKYYNDVVTGKIIQQAFSTSDENLDELTLQTVFLNEVFGTVTDQSGVKIIYSYDSLVDGVPSTVTVEKVVHNNNVNLQDIITPENILKDVLAQGFTIQFTLKSTISNGMQPRTTSLNILSEIDYELEDDSEAPVIQAQALLTNPTTSNNVNTYTLDTDTDTGATKYDLTELFSIQDGSGDIVEVRVTYNSGSYRYPHYNDNEQNRFIKEIISKTQTKTYNSSDNKHSVPSGDIETEIMKDVPGYYDITLTVIDDHDNIAVKRVVIKVVDVVSTHVDLGDLFSVDAIYSDSSTSSPQYLARYGGDENKIEVQGGNVDRVSLRYRVLPTSFTYKNYYNSSLPTNLRMKKIFEPQTSITLTYDNTNNKFEGYNELDYTVPGIYNLEFTVSYPNDEENGLYKYNRQQYSSIGKYVLKVVDNTLPEILYNGSVVGEDVGEDVNGVVDVSSGNTSGITIGIKTNNNAQYDPSINKYVIVTSITKVDASDNKYEEVYSLVNALETLEVVHPNIKEIVNLGVNELTANTNIDGLLNIVLETNAVKTTLGLELSNLDIIGNNVNEPSGWNTLTCVGNQEFIVSMVPIVMEGKFTAIGSKVVLHVHNQLTIKTEIEVEAPITYTLQEGALLREIDENGNTVSVEPIIDPLTKYEDLLDAYNRLVGLDEGINSLNYSILEIQRLISIKENEILQSRVDTITEVTDNKTKVLESWSSVNALYEFSVSKKPDLATTDLSNVRGELDSIAFRNSNNALELSGVSVAVLTAQPPLSDASFETVVIEYKTLFENYKDELQRIFDQIIDVADNDDNKPDIGDDPSFNVIESEASGNIVDTTTEFNELEAKISALTDLISQLTTKQEQVSNTKDEITEAETVKQTTAPDIEAKRTEAKSAPVVRQTPRFAMRFL